MFPASGPDNLVHVGHRQEHVDCQTRLLLVIYYLLSQWSITMLSYLWLVLIQVDLLMFPVSERDNLVHVGHRQEHVDCQTRRLLEIYYLLSQWSIKMLSYLWLVLIQVDLLMFPASEPDNLVHVGHRQGHVDCQTRPLLVIYCL